MPVCDQTPLNLWVHTDENKLIIVDVIILLSTLYFCEFYACSFAKIHAPVCKCVLVAHVMRKYSFGIVPCCKIHNKKEYKVE